MSAPGRSHPYGPSLRRQLLRPLVWIWLLGSLFAGGGAYVLAQASAHAAFDRGLQDEASALAAKVMWYDRGPQLDLSRQAMELLTWDRDDRNGFAMLDADGNALAGDADLPVPPQLNVAFEQPLLFDAAYHGQQVRGAVFSIKSPMLDRTVSIVVVETTNKRERLQRTILAGVLLPGTAIGVAMVLLQARAIRLGLQPLREVAAEVAAREMHDWRPLRLERVPAEAVPLIERINVLMEEMQQAVQLQRRFVADAAHQLRTPVAGLRVIAQELQHELGSLPSADGAAAPGWAPLLQQVLASTERMNRLVHQLLSLARSETALSVTGEQASMDVVPLLRDAAEPMVLRSLREGRTLAFEAPDHPVIARAHPLWLGEVVSNLLDNALRYGGPQIVLAVQAVEGGGARVWVQDDGEGVPAEDLKRLFEPFWRGMRADLRNDGGTGLGLAIAREIVERLGGHLEARTRPEVPGLWVGMTLAP